MSNLPDVLAMGGHGVYVWSAYGITATVLILGKRRLVQAEARRRRREGM